MSTLRDERGQQSAARTFLLWALVYQAAYLVLWGREEDTLGVTCTFFAAIDTPLIIWAAGPRIAQYLGPQAGAIVQGVAESAKALAAKIRARRGADGTEPAGKVPQVYPDD
jgi:hypothetical protein